MDAISQAMQSQAAMIAQLTKMAANNEQGMAKLLEQSADRSKADQKAVLGAGQGRNLDLSA